MAQLTIYSLDNGYRISNGWDKFGEFNGDKVFQIDSNSAKLNSQDIENSIRPIVEIVMKALVEEEINRRERQSKQ